MILTPDQWALSQCGLPEFPGKENTLPLYGGFLFVQSIPASSIVAASQLPFYADQPFFLSSISAYPLSTTERNLLVRFGLPDGRWLSNAPIPLRHYVISGTNRKMIEPRERFNPGQKLTVYVQNTAVSAVTLTLFFEGAPWRFVEDEC